jgi:hypothetical protein
MRTLHSPEVGISWHTTGWVRLQIRMAPGKANLKTFPKKNLAAGNFR